MENTEQDGDRIKQELKFKYHHHLDYLGSTEESITGTMWKDFIREKFFIEAIKNKNKGKMPFRPPRHPPNRTDRSQAPRQGQDHHHSERYLATPEYQSTGFTLGHRGHAVISKGGDSVALLKSSVVGRLL